MRMPKMLFLNGALKGVLRGSYYMIRTSMRIEEYIKTPKGLKFLKICQNICTKISRFDFQIPIFKTQTPLKMEKSIV